MASDVPNRDLVLDVRRRDKSPLVIAGVVPGGMSPQADMDSGGATYFFTRIYKIPAELLTPALTMSVSAFMRNADFRSLRNQVSDITFAGSNSIPLEGRH